MINSSPALVFAMLSTASGWGLPSNDSLLSTNITRLQQRELLGCIWVLALRAFSALSTLQHSALTNSLTTHCSLLTAAHPDDSILLLQPHMRPIAAEEL